MFEELLTDYPGTSSFAAFGGAIDLGTATDLGAKNRTRREPFGWQTLDLSGTDDVDVIVVHVESPESKEEISLTPIPAKTTGPSNVDIVPSIFDITENTSDDLDALVMAAELGSEAIFARAISQIDWSQRPAVDFTRGVHLALAAGAHLHARLLAIQGAKLYPEEPELRKMAHILAPPRVVRADLSADSSMEANRDWLNANRASYRGQWVALHKGELLAAASTVRDLQSRLGSLDSVLVTKVS